MKSYGYLAADRAGANRRGVVLATSERAAVGQLSRQGLLPIRVAEVTQRSRIGGGPSRRDLAVAFRSLAGLVEVGVPLSDAMDATRRVVPPTLAESLLRVATFLEHGHSLVGAFEQGGINLPAGAAGVLLASELSGELGHGLEQTAAVLERGVEMNDRVRQALAYPMVLTATGLFSLVLIVGVVVPRFAQLLKDLGQEPPPATRFLLGAAAALKWAGPLLLLGLTTAAAAAFATTRDPRHAIWIHRSLIRLPSIGSVLHQLASGRAAESLGRQLASGVPLLPAMDGAAAAAGNAEVAARLRRARSIVAEGHSLAGAFAKEAALTVQIIRLTELGEANGRLAETLVRAGALSLADAERRLRTLVGLLEPILILGFALIVGLVATALLQAVYSLRPGGP